MSKYSELFTYLRTCPQLADLWSIGATEDVGVNVILPQGSSSTAQYRSYRDTTGAFNCDVTPEPAVFEDYQINCFRLLDANDSSTPAFNINVLQIEDVQAIIDWIFAQDAAGNMPTITGETVVSIECNPRVPQIRYINNAENTVAYFITLRVYFVNKRTARSVTAP